MVSGDPTVYDVFIPNQIENQGPLSKYETIIILLRDLYTLSHRSIIVVASRCVIMYVFSHGNMHL